jgi:hypothetical protein
LPKTAFIKFRVEPSLKKELQRHYHSGSISEELYRKVVTMVEEAKKNYPGPYPLKDVTTEKENSA